MRIKSVLVRDLLRGAVVFASIQLLIALCLWLYPDSLDAPWLEGTLEAAAVFAYGIPGGIPLIFVFGPHRIDALVVTVAAVLNWICWTPVVAYFLRTRKEQA